MYLVLLVFAMGMTSIVLRVGVEHVPFRKYFRENELVVLMTLASLIAIVFWIARVVVH